MSATVDTRDRLARIRRELATLREHRAEHVRALADLRTAAAENPTQAAVRNVASATNAKADLDEQIERLREQESQLLSGLSSNGTGARAGGLVDDRLSDPEFAAQLDRIAHSHQRLGGELLIAEIPREQVAGWFGSRLAQAPGTVAPTPGMTRPAHRGVLPALPAETALLDLIPGGTTDSNSIEYAAEVRTGAGDVGLVEPGAVKPQVQIEWQDRESAVATIAGFVKVRRNSLGDIGNLRTLIDGTLRDRTRNAVEAQAADGTGETSDKPGVSGIVGLTRVGGTGRLPAAADAGELLDKIRRGLIVVKASGGVANACALSLDDWDQIMGLRDDSGRFIFDPTALQQTAWGLTFTPTTALATGTAVVADTVRSMQLAVRQGVEIRASDSDQDDFVRNRITVLAETRVAFCVWRPALIVVIGGPEAEDGNGEGSNGGGA